MRMLACTIALGLFAQPATATSGWIVETVAGPDPRLGDGLSTDPAGNIYAGSFQPTLTRVSVDGTLSTLVSGNSAVSDSELGPDGLLYYCDYNLGRVQRTTLDGTSALFANVPGGPVGLAFAEDGYLYVAQYLSNRISRIAPDGSSVEIVALGSPLAGPAGISFGDDGLLYVGNFNDGRVVAVDVVAQTKTVVAGPVVGGRIGYLTTANGVMYATGLHRVHEITYGGVVTSFAGTGVAGTTDGPSDEALFSVPNGITATASGDTIYVSQSQSNRYLRRIYRETPVGVGAAEPVGQAPFGVRPNPARAWASLRFTVVIPGEVAVELFDASGRLVLARPLGNRTPGTYETELDLRRLRPGVYFYRLTGAVRMETGRFTILP